MGAVGKAWDAVSVSFDRFCLTAGIEALGTMMEKGRRGGLRGSPCPQRWPARPSLGLNPGQDRLPRRQGGG
jgi:hypothetical protein